MRPRGAFRWRKGCEGDGEQEESVRGWRDGADGRNAKDVRDWTVVSKGDATGHEKSGAIGTAEPGPGEAAAPTTGDAAFAAGHGTLRRGPRGLRRGPGAVGSPERTGAGRRRGAQSGRGGLGSGSAGSVRGAWHALPGLIPTRAPRVRNARTAA